MYSFVRGARLFVKGTREPDDPDNLPDPGDRNGTDEHHVSIYHQTKSQMASASQESKEVFRTAHNRSGLRTVHTSRVIRKTTTLTRGDHKIPMRTSGTQHEAILPSSLSDNVDNDLHVKRVHKVYDTTDSRKKIRTNKVGPIFINS